MDAPPVPRYSASNAHAQVNPPRISCPTGCSLIPHWRRRNDGHPEDGSPHRPDPGRGCACSRRLYVCARHRRRFSCSRCHLRSRLVDDPQGLVQAQYLGLGRQRSQFHPGSTAYPQPHFSPLRASASRPQMALSSFPPGAAGLFVFSRPEASSGSDPPRPRLSPSRIAPVSGRGTQSLHSPRSRRSPRCSSGLDGALRTT